ncbi:MAG: LysR family transcriptional regulator [Burkholderiaceae bacterium]|nr:LysR family transcriptional regulator [Burkholderiaceae bacterium]
MLLREIEVFRAVMGAGSTSKAATLLGISQPAVSQIIRKLETSAEFRLFERVRGRLVPTQEAEALLAEVNQCFVGLELIQHRIRSLRSGVMGRLRIAAYPAYGTSFVPRAIARMQPQLDNMKVSLQVMSSRDVYQNVLAGQYDFGLMADETPASGLEHHAFAHMNGVIVMAPGHALARKSVIEPADLVAHPHVGLNPEDASRLRLEKMLQATDHLLAPVVETPYASTICELALAGVGIGLVNPIVAIDFVERGLVIRPFSLNVLFSCVMVSRPGVLMSEASKTLLRCMRMQLADDQEKLRTLRGQGDASPRLRVA